MKLITEESFEVRKAMSERTAVLWQFPFMPTTVEITFRVLVDKPADLVLECPSGKLRFSVRGDNDGFGPMTVYAADFDQARLLCYPKKKGDVVEARLIQTNRCYDSIVDAVGSLSMESS